MKQSMTRLFTKKICSKTQEQLKAWLAEEYKDIIAEDRDGYLLLRGTVPVLYIAHLDTVHKDLPSIICTDNERGVIMSPQGIGGDDRCGIFIGHMLAQRTNSRPWVLFTEDEEIGGIGANKFADDVPSLDLPEFKFAIECDRKGSNDAVYYSMEDQNFYDFVESFGYKEAFGSYSDIEDVCPAIGCMGVNLSCGYYNAHTTSEYVVVGEMLETLATVEAMCSVETEKFPYKRCEFSYSKWFQNYGDYTYGYIPRKETVDKYVKAKDNEEAEESDEFAELYNEIMLSDVGYYAQQLEAEFGYSQQQIVALYLIDCTGGTLEDTYWEEEYPDYYAQKDSNFDTNCALTE